MSCTLYLSHCYNIYAVDLTYSGPTNAQEEKDGFTVEFDMNRFHTSEYGARQFSHVDGKEEEEEEEEDESGSDNDASW